MALRIGDEVPDFTAESTAPGRAAGHALEALAADRRPPPGAAQGIDADWIESLCRLARDYLERKTAALSEEVRNYPRPIARCDDQLPALLESRARALLHLERLRALGERERARADGVGLVGKLVDALAERPAA
jgi:hypothetical protein